MPAAKVISVDVAIAEVSSVLDGAFTLKSLSFSLLPNGFGLSLGEHSGA